MPYIGVLGDIDLPSKQVDSCFMYRTLTSSSAKRTKEISIMNGDSPQHAPLLITHRREMQPLHLDDDARASSLRRVTGDLYIGGSSTGPAPVSRPTLYPTMRRDATRLLRRLDVSTPHVIFVHSGHLVNLTTVLPPRCARVSHMEEGTPAYVMLPITPTTVD